MNELIKFENGKLSQQTIDIIKNYELQMKSIKEKYEQFKEDLKEAMKSNGIVKFESDDLLINYIAEIEKETFDSKQFKIVCPELYDEYVKMTTQKPSIRIKVKK